MGAFGCFTRSAVLFLCAFLLACCSGGDGSGGSSSGDGGRHDGSGGKSGGQDAVPPGPCLLERLSSDGAEITGRARFFYDSDGVLEAVEPDGIGVDGSADGEPDDRYAYIVDPDQGVTGIMARGGLSYEPFCRQFPWDTLCFDFADSTLLAPCEAPPVSCEFDAGGRLTVWEFDADGDGAADMQSSYSYDAAGRLVGDTDRSTNQGTYRATFTYDAAGHLVERVWRAADADGALDSAPERTVYSYDASGCLARSERFRGDDPTPRSVKRYSCVCDDSGGGSGGGSTSDVVAPDDARDAPDVSGSQDTGSSPVTDCLPGIPCVRDDDCEAGQHCNDGYAPPACQWLYCGAEGSVCDETALCEPGLVCDEGMCVFATDGSVAVDLLVVVDDSASMCQEQTVLAAGIQTLAARMTDSGDIDLRLAVTSTAVLVEGRGGHFLAAPTTDFPPLCHEERLFPAASDLDCECAACAGFEAARSWQVCQDHPDIPGCASSRAEPTVYTACRVAGACASESLAALWRWAPPTGYLANQYNLNGSTNSRCQFRCGEGSLTVADAREQGTSACRTWFDDDSMSCQGPTPDSTGCIRAPDTVGCPADLPAVLPAFAADGSIRYGFDYARCLVTLGVDQSVHANHEQGMAAAWLALAEGGMAPTQICVPGDPALSDESLTTAEKRQACERRFLRDGAWLVVLFVSDEDDCSVVEGREIMAEDVSACALLGDDETEPLAPPRVASTDERPLATVSSYVARLHALRSDPSRIVVAAIAGDARRPSGALGSDEADALREAYFASKIDSNNPLSISTWICASPLGRADFGARYLRLTDAFGDHGFFYNLCGGALSLDAFATDLLGLLSE